MSDRTRDTDQTQETDHARGSPGEATAPGPMDALEGLRLRALGLLAAVFVAGALAGAAAVHLWPDAGAPAFDGPPAGGLAAAPGELPPALRRLDLTEDQRDRILEILGDTRPRTDSILRVALPRLRRLADSVRAEIRAVLTPEQRERLRRQAPAFGPGGLPGEGPPVRPRRRPPP